METFVIKTRISAGRSMPVTNRGATEEPLLSICIPSYNRKAQVNRLVESLLQSPRSDFEVLVLDNCSTDGTDNLLQEITDLRFHYYRNEVNIGGIRNGFASLRKGRGRYLLLCLDKDWVNTVHLPLALALLDQNSHWSCGYFRLDQKEIGECVTLEKGFEGIYGGAYTCKHPSGYFYSRRLVSQIDEQDFYTTRDLELGFGGDLLFAELAMQGPSAIIEIPLITMESFDQAAIHTSFTYSKEKQNLYFMPRQRFEVLKSFVDHSKSLGITATEVRALSTRLYEQQLVASTWLYRWVRQNPLLCAHYHLPVTRIAPSELVTITLFFSWRFLFLEGLTGVLDRLSFLLKRLVKRVLKRSSDTVKGVIRAIYKRTIASLFRELE